MSATFLLVAAMGTAAGLAAVIVCGVAVLAVAAIKIGESLREEYLKTRPSADKD